MATIRDFLYYIVKFYIISTCLYKNTEGENLPLKFPAILIFGDSLVDTGNNNYISTIFKANHVPYGMSFPNRVPTGRFSNGKLMSDMLASALGIKDLVPPFLDPNLPTNELKTGVCFASAGSGYDDTTTTLSNVIPVSKQIDYFKQYKDKLESSIGAEKANQSIRNALVFFVAGSNDYIINYYASPIRRAQFTPLAYQDYLHNQIQNYTTALYDLGCRNFMVAGIPPLADSLSYNQKLSVLLPKIQGALPGSKFVYADIAKPLTRLSINPIQFGLVVLTMPCCGGFIGGDCRESSVPCPNPNQYLRWDSIHPTEVVYKVMTQSLLDNSLSQFFK